MTRVATCLTRPLSRSSVDQNSSQLLTGKRSPARLPRSISGNLAEAPTRAPTRMNHRQTAARQRPRSSRNHPSWILRLRPRLSVREAILSALNGAQSSRRIYSLRRMRRLTALRLTFARRYATDVFTSRTGAATAGEAASSRTWCNSLFHRFRRCSTTIKIRLATSNSRAYCASSRLSLTRAASSTTQSTTTTRSTCWSAFGRTTLKCSASGSRTCG